MAYALASAFFGLTPNHENRGIMAGRVLFEGAHSREHSALGAAHPMRSIRLHPGTFRAVSIGLLAILSTKACAQQAGTTYRADANLVTITFSVEKEEWTAAQDARPGRHRGSGERQAPTNSVS